MGVPLTPEELAYATELFRKSGSVKATARVLGLSYRGTIGRLRRTGALVGHSPRKLLAAENEASIIGYMRSRGEPVTYHEVAAATYLHVDTVRNLLYRKRDAGEVTRTRVGSGLGSAARWELA